MQNTTSNSDAAPSSRDALLHTHLDMTTRPSMNKTQWTEKLDTLQKAHSDFLLYYPRYQNGGNARERDEAEKKVDQSIGMSRLLIEGNSEILAFFDNTDHGTLYGHDEFFMARKFTNDMNDFLQRLKSYIASLPDEPSTDG